MCIVGLRRRAATLWLLVSALEACSTLGGRALAAILRRRSLVEARSRARCSAAEPRFLEGEEAALVALEMGEGGDAWLPFFSDPHQAHVSVEAALREFKINAKGVCFLQVTLQGHQGGRALNIVKGCKGRDGLGKLQQAR